MPQGVRVQISPRSLRNIDREARCTFAKCKPSVKGCGSSILSCSAREIIITFEQDTMNKQQREFLENNRNLVLQANGILLLESIPNDSMGVSIFDPQYRKQLDKLKYGNEGKSRQKKRSALPQMSDVTVISFLFHIQRTLKPSGYMFLWVDKFSVAEGVHRDWFNVVNSATTDSNPIMNLVDMIVWDKKSFGMGARSRRTNEYLLVYQKSPKTTKNWIDKTIRDTWSEKVPSPRKGHPHRKPKELMSKLINATTKVGDYILDPCAGSFSMLDVALKTKRNFIGCDLDTQYAEEGLPR